ncbi:MAG: hypothetical protein QOI62_3138 [Solirubrobacteraceae bacterium]|jgi:hypothetical protein|nr:hypothetical protein [Solirubrobacteraceae bacterium]
MSPAPTIRTQACSADQARKRLQDARKFLEVADLVDDEPAVISAGVAASLAVLAGIAACDAACCAALGLRSRGESHDEAVAVLRRARGAGDVANAFQRLLRIKNDAQYGLRTISAPKRRAALRHAGKMVDFAEHVLADAA